MPTRSLESGNILGPYTDSCDQRLTPQPVHQAQNHYYRDQHDDIEDDPREFNPCLYHDPSEPELWLSVPPSDAISCLPLSPVVFTVTGADGLEWSLEVTLRVTDSENRLLSSVTLDNSFLLHGKPLESSRDHIHQIDAKAWDFVYHGISFDRERYNQAHENISTSKDFFYEFDARLTYRDPETGNVLKKPVYEHTYYSCPEDRNKRGFHKEYHIFPLRVLSFKMKESLMEGWVEIKRKMRKEKHRESPLLL